MHKLMIAILGTALCVISIANPLALSSAENNTKETPTFKLEADKQVVNVGDELVVKLVPTNKKQPAEVFWRFEGDEDWSKGSPVYKRKTIKAGVVSLSAVEKDTDGLYSQRQTILITINDPNGNSTIDEHDNSHPLAKCYYETTFGILHFSVQGNDVFGKIDYQNGIGNITGKLNGNVLTGKWMQPQQGSGNLQFVFDKDLNTFKGVWGNEGDEFPSETWDGKKITCFAPSAKK